MECLDYVAHCPGQVDFRDQRKPNSRWYAKIQDGKPVGIRISFAANSLSEYQGKLHRQQVVEEKKREHELAKKRLDTCEKKTS